MKKFIKLTGLSFLIFTSFFHSCKKEEIPTLSTSSIANITSTSASSGGVISSDGGADVTARGVCWSLNTNPSISDSKTSDGGGDGQFTSNLTGLSAGTTYHVRAYATNSVGTAYGAELSFTTLGEAPECITQAASNITSTGVTLNGTVNANHASTTVTFQYGPTTDYGQTVTAVQSPVEGSSITNVSVELTGMEEGKIYHYRIIAVNSLGKDEGEDMTFTTSGHAPEVTTNTATDISTASAKLSGAVNAHYASTMVTFDYGTTEAYGNSVVATPNPVTGNTSTIVSADIASLHPGTIYHFRIKAVSSVGTVYGENMTFTTLGQVPTVVTQQASNVQITTATLNGTINANHLSTIYNFEYGLTTSYSNTASPTSNQITGSADVNVSINLVGLVGGTTYHYRVLATNQLGTTYGEDVAFTTGDIISLSTNPITGVEYNSAIGGGNIINDGGSAITARGVCWSKNPNPTIVNDHTIDGTGTGSFTSQIKCLDEMTLYYVRAYATNSEGTVYGDQRSFTTGPCPIAFNPDLTYGMVTDIDGNCYKTIQIGDQIWMAENLRTTRYNDGSAIPYVVDDEERVNLTTGAYFLYDDNVAAYMDIYGALYNMFAVEDSRNICPTGWHVSTYDDWVAMGSYIGGWDFGGRLKETGTIHWISPNVGATNELGFTALPGGSTGGFFVGSIGEMGIWWAFSGYDSEYLYDFRIYNTETQLTGYDKNSRNAGFSVRCVKD